MEIITDIFITLFLMVIVGGGFWCLLKFLGWFSNEYGKTTIYDHLPNRKN